MTKKQTWLWKDKAKREKDAQICKRIAQAMHAVQTQRGKHGNQYDSENLNRLWK